MIPNQNKKYLFSDSLDELSRKIDRFKCHDKFGNTIIVEQKEKNEILELACVNAWENHVKNLNWFTKNLLFFLNSLGNNRFVELHLKKALETYNEHLKENDIKTLLITIKTTGYISKFF